MATVKVTCKLCKIYVVFFVISYNLFYCYFLCRYKEEILQELEEVFSVRNLSKVAGQYFALNYYYYPRPFLSFLYHPVHTTS